EHRRLPGGKLMQELGVLRRPDEADERAALAQQRDFVAARRAHLEDDVGHRPEPGGVVDDFGAGRTVGGVAYLGRVAGTRFDGNPEALLDQLLDDLGHGGDPFLAGKALAWD